MMNNLSIAALAGIASAKLLRPSTLNSQAIGEYNNFVGKFGRETVTREEFEYRVGVFIDNQAYVNKVNAEAEQKGGNAVTLEMNKFGDCTPKDMEKYMGIAPDRQANNAGFGRRVGWSLGDHAAVTVDHHAAGKMTPVKNQGQCGSCWAFASNTALEGSLAISSGRAPLRLSEQQLVDCTLGDRKDTSGKSYGMLGCGGGWMSVSWDYQKGDGFMTDADYPYTSGTSQKESECAYKADKKIGRVTSWKSLDGVQAVLDKVKQQPVSIAIHASSRDFQLYKTGVLQYASCYGQLNHGVVVVGYTLAGDGDDDRDNNDNEIECKVTKWWHSCNSSSRRLADSKGLDNYFKVQNSWGDWWGDNGFVRFNIDESGPGVCGMYNYPEYVEAEYTD